MKIGILQCGHALPEAQEKFGSFSTMFEALLVGQNFEFQSWDVVDMDFPSLTDADGWLLTGSRHGAYEEHAFIPPLTEFIRAAYEQSSPMVGICFGHQIIAQALGGKVEKYAGGWSIGTREYETSDGSTLRLNAWHQDQVVALPPGAQVTAQNDFCKYAGLAYGDKALTIQPHPEFSNSLIAEYARLRLGTGTFPEEMLRAAQEQKKSALDSGKYAQTIANFFRTARRPKA
jgi:GMP synthase-like glutamine amidotransferase